MVLSASKPTLLCLDASTAACSVALSRDGKIYSRFEIASRQHTRLLLPMIDEVLTEAGIQLSQVDALGFTIGPGSFTGIRIGFGVAQGLAFGAGLPVVPVSTLEAQAVAAQSKFRFPEGELVLTLLDARMDECYWAVFRVEQGGALRRVTEDGLSSPEEVAPDLGENKLHVVGDGWSYSDRLSISTKTVEPEFYPDAEAVLSVAANKLGSGLADSIENVQPVYLRDKISWKKRQRLRPERS